MKKIIIILVFVLLCSLFAGCSEEDSSSREENYTEQMKQQSLDIVGLPDIINFFEMAQLKEIYEMRDDPNLIMYWYTKSEMTGKWVYEGKCIGYGIPYGASITNPEEYMYNGATLPLAEPNGLYTNTVTSSATWVLAIDVDGNIQPNYVESEIRVTPFKIDKNKIEEWSLPSDY